MKFSIKPNHLQMGEIQKSSLLLVFCLGHVSFLRSVHGDSDVYDMGNGVRAGYEIYQLD